MSYPWMIIVGVMLIGWLAPEVLAAFAKVEIPIGMNIFSAIAFGLIAGGIVL